MPKRNVLEGLPSDSCLVLCEWIGWHLHPQHDTWKVPIHFSFTLHPDRVILASLESLSFLCKFATEVQQDFLWFPACVPLVYGPCAPN